MAATCPTCKRRLPKPRKPKARPLEPWECFVAGVARFAAFAAPEWPDRVGQHAVAFRPSRSCMECGKARCAALHPGILSTRL